MRNAPEGTGYSAPNGAAAGSRVQARRRRQRQEARQAILDATEDLILESGGSGFSIRSLTDRAGYSAPTLYHYFDDKDGLIAALLEDRVGRLADEFERLPPSGDSLADLRAMLLAYVEFSASNPAFTRLMGTISRKGESRTPAAMERVRHCVAVRLDDFARAGALKGFDRANAGRVLWALAMGLAALRIESEADTDDVPWPSDLAERAIDSLFLGMAELDKEKAVR